MACRHAHMARRTASRSRLTEVREVVGRMTALADWMGRFKPTCEILTLWPADYECICRNSDVAARFGIVVSPCGPPRWRQFELKALGSEASEFSLPAYGGRGGSGLTFTDPEVEAPSGRSRADGPDVDFLRISGFSCGGSGSTLGRYLPHAGRAFGAHAATLCGSRQDDAEGAHRRNPTPP